MEQVSILEWMVERNRRVGGNIASLDMFLKFWDDGRSLRSKDEFPDKLPLEEWERRYLSWSRF